MDIEKVKERLRRFEGYRKYPYRCPAGYLTIGYGRNLEVKGISVDEAKMLLNNDVNETIEILLNGLEFFIMLPEQAQEVLVDMTFNMGFAGVLKFKKFLEALKNKDWERASQEMENSLWYKQTGNRAKELVKIIRELKDGQ